MMSGLGRLLPIVALVVFAAACKPKKPPGPKLPATAESSFDAERVTLDLDAREADELDEYEESDEALDDDDDEDDAVER